MDQHARVTDAGEVPVQGVGNVRVADMSPSEAATAIHDRFVSAHYLNHPQVSVVVDQYATQKVTLIGEVRTPRRLSDRDPTPNSRRDRTWWGLESGRGSKHPYGAAWRPEPSHPLQRGNDAEQAIKEQVLVNPGDTVVVPKAGIVYVLGDVNRPGGLHHEQ